MYLEQIKNEITTTTTTPFPFSPDSLYKKGHKESQMRYIQKTKGKYSLRMVQAHPPLLLHSGSPPRAAEQLSPDPPSLPPWGVPELPSSRPWSPAGRSKQPGSLARRGRAAWWSALVGASTHRPSRHSSRAPYLGGVGSAPYEEAVARLSLAAATPPTFAGSDRLGFLG